MKTFALLAVSLFLQTMTTHAQPIDKIAVKDIDHKPTTLSAYQGKVLLIVNVASKCGFTPQYAALESVYEKYKDKGLVILGFPCNQFGGKSRAPTRRSSFSAPANTMSLSRSSRRST